MSVQQYFLCQNHSTTGRKLLILCIGKKSVLTVQWLFLGHYKDAAIVSTFASHDVEREGMYEGKPAMVHLHEDDRYLARLRADREINFIPAKNHSSVDGED